jgi:monofunctional biosynthetic peptidoglycan transglycosylase
MTARRRARGLWIRRALAAVAIVVVLWLVWEAATWPDVRALASRPPTTTAFIERYKERERAAGRTPRVEWRWVPTAVISITLKRAVVLAEDAGFFNHHGFAPKAMREAMTQALEERRAPRGASTITQQLAKNLWLSPSRSPLRKAREAVMTWQLERALSKRRILELYLNVVEFGPGAYGVEAASRRYFGKSAAEVDSDEAAQLAASLPRPRAWHPGVTTTAYRRYVSDIRRRMDRVELPSRLLQ